MSQAQSDPPDEHTEAKKKYLKPQIDELAKTLEGRSEELREALRQVRKTSDWKRIVPFVASVAAVLSVLGAYYIRREGVDETFIALAITLLLCEALLYLHLMLGGQTGDLEEVSRSISAALIPYWLAPIGIFAFSLSLGGDGIDILAPFSMSLLVSGASGLIGTFLGFLFGMPRRSEDGSPPDEESLLYRSNMLEVSDWLTKILIGAGLVELAMVPPQLRALAYYFEMYTPIGNGTFGVLISIHGLLCGFFIGFFAVQLYLDGVLRRRADQLEKRQAGRGARSSTRRQSEVVERNGVEERV